MQIPFSLSLLLLHYILMRISSIYIFLCDLSLTFSKSPSLFLSLAISQFLHIYLFFFLLALVFYLFLSIFLSLPFTFSFSLLSSYSQILFLSRFLLASLTFGCRITQLDNFSPFRPLKPCLWWTYHFISHLFALSLSKSFLALCFTFSLFSSIFLLNFYSYFLVSSQVLIFAISLSLDHFEKRCYFPPFFLVKRTI